MSQKMSEKMTSKMHMDQRAFIYFCVQLGKTPTETKKWWRDKRGIGQCQNHIYIRDINVFQKAFVICRTLRGLEDLCYVRIAGNSMFMTSSQQTGVLG
jgi:hypothetical protein